MEKRIIPKTKKNNRNDVLKIKSSNKNNTAGRFDKTPQAKHHKSKILNCDLDKVADQSSNNIVPKFDIDDSVACEMTNDETTQLAKAAHNLRRSYFNKKL